MGVAYSVGEVDHLYTFFVQWSPSLGPKLDTKLRMRRLLREDKHKRSISSLLTQSAPQHWDIITVRKSARSQSVCSSQSFCSSQSVCTSEDEEEKLPVLNQSSCILQQHHIQRLVDALPPRVQGTVWTLVYSTNDHGTSLRTLYRRTAQIRRPVLLLIKDMQNQVFGAFCSDTLKVSDKCYGTGETFLFTFGPEFKTFCWSGENSYFVRGFLDSLQLGAGGGRFGLWLDADLCRGSTFSCNTFRNQPLSRQNDFKIQALEVWTFQ
ncbi:nuclear receptor coactivator 7 isoform X2 [Hoplias malabaricus]|uniref:nuclear receptor coactivator 7 isoform X2 n=1 Tax=Hoplias malabaricus TaxID=27720 RepID=UPI0034628BEA